MKRINFKPENTCCKNMLIYIENDTIYDVLFVGGCQGNLTGIRNLIKGMKITEVVEKLQGIPCGKKDTSCPDQLAKRLQKYLENGGNNEDN